MIIPIKYTPNKNIELRIELEDIEELLFINFVSENIEFQKLSIVLNDRVNGIGITTLTIDHPKSIVDLKRYAIKNINKKFSRSYKDTSFGSYVHYVSNVKLNNINGSEEII